MAPPTLSTNHSLETLFDEMFFTATTLGADPHAATSAVAFSAFLQKDWQPVAERERALRCGVLLAQAAVGSLDARLDTWVDRFHHTLLMSTGNRRDVPQYQRYFGALPPSLLKRPVLGAQLETVAAWLPSIQSGSDAALTALGKELDGLVTDGQQAEAGLDLARSVVKDFREVGARRALFDKANALRQTTFGELAGWVHDHPEKNLDPDWADGFFRRIARDRLSPYAERARILGEIGELNENLVERQQRLSQLDAQHAAVEAQENERRAVEERLRALEAETREKQAQAQALRSQLGLTKSARRLTIRRTK